MPHSDTGASVTPVCLAHGRARDRDVPAIGRLVPHARGPVERVALAPIDHACGLRAHLKSK